MTPRARTNQLLYQAELLLDAPARDDEHAESRRMAQEEGALALLELALEALLRDVTEHAHLAEHDWQELLLGPQRLAVAEVQRLRVLADDGDTWLGWLVDRLSALHGDGGVARRRDTGSTQLISIAGQALLGDELRSCVRDAKREIAALRETSEEW